jgi:hypothetical protein
LDQTVVVQESEKHGLHGAIPSYTSVNAIDGVVADMTVATAPHRRCGDSMMRPNVADA